MGVRYDSKKAGLLFVFAVLLSFSVHSGASEGGERTEVFGAKTGVRKLARNGGVRYVEVEITLS